VDLVELVQKGRVCFEGRLVFVLQSGLLTLRLELQFQLWLGLRAGPTGVVHLLVQDGGQRLAIALVVAEVGVLRLLLGSVLVLSLMIDEVVVRRHSRRLVGSLVAT